MEPQHAAEIAFTKNHICELSRFIREDQLRLCRLRQQIMKEEVEHGSFKEMRQTKFDIELGLKEQFKQINDSFFVLSQLQDTMKPFENLSSSDS